MLAPDDSDDYQDSDGEMILEVQPAGDHFKSNFYEFCGKNLLEISERNITNKINENKKGE